MDTNTKLSQIRESELNGTDYNFDYKINDKNIRFRTYHFLSSYSHKMITSLNVEYYSNDFKYELKREFPETLLYEDFLIEFEKTVRKFKKMFVDIFLKFDFEENENENELAGN